MARITFSTKRLQIDKTNARIVVIIALASVLTTFSLVASKALLDQRSYQSRVITEKKKAADQLKQNLEAVDSLKNSYAQFVTAQENIIKGNSTGSGEQDGDNAKIILDALPSKYDFPAFTSSVEKMIKRRNVSLESISGSDDEITQHSQTSGPNPEPIEVPIQFTVKSDIISLALLVKEFELSIRPMHITALSITADKSEVTLDLSVKSYYQPATSLNITTKDVQ